LQHHLAKITTSHPAPRSFSVAMPRLGLVAGKISLQVQNSSARGALAPCTRHLARCPAACAPVQWEGSGQLASQPHGRPYSLLHTSLHTNDTVLCLAGWAVAAANPVPRRLLALYAPSPTTGALAAAGSGSSSDSSSSSGSSRGGFHSRSSSGDGSGILGILGVSSSTSSRRHLLGVQFVAQAAPASSSSGNGGGSSSSSSGSGDAGDTDSGGSMTNGGGAAAARSSGGSAWSALSSVRNRTIIYCAKKDAGPRC
jgi:hypothetical protein